MRFAAIQTDPFEFWTYQFVSFDGIGVVVDVLTVVVVGGVVVVVVVVSGFVVGVGFVVVSGFVVGVGFVVVVVVVVVRLF